MNHEQFLETQRMVLGFTLTRDDFVSLSAYVRGFFRGKDWNDREQVLALAKFEKQVNRKIRSLKVCL
jgi:hypothetical protein